MSQKFQAAVHHRDDVNFVKLAGVIDEDNELTELTEKIQASTVIIDLGEIERINSCGVRDWVNWLGKVENKNTEVVLVECSPAIVAQINLVNNFTGSGVVKSFYVPYFCPECDEEKVLLCEAADLGPPPHEPPTCRCDECDLVMDFDDMPDSYFAFLASQKKVPRPEKIQSVIDEFASGDDEKSKIRSRVGSQNISSAGIPSGSLPTVPSLPSISRTPVNTRPGGLAELTGNSRVPGQAAAAAAPTGKSNPLVYALVVLGIAIVVLGGILLFSK
jgi:anti-anti-sigma regulatory factor